MRTSSVIAVLTMLTTQAVAMLRTGFELRGFDPTTAIADLGKTVPLGRIAQPEDIAEAVLFLSSDHARYMCGTLLEINGGKSVA